MPGRAFQHYQGATNLLMTELTWRAGTDPRPGDRLHGQRANCLPRTADGSESPRGSTSSGSAWSTTAPSPFEAVFGVYVQAEINGGIGASRA